MEYQDYQWRQPQVVVQTEDEIKRGYCKGTYVLMWANVSARFGIFRCEPLKDNLGMNKRHVMQILKAAYRDVTLRSFNDAIALCNAVGIKLGYYDKKTNLVYLAY